MKVTGDDALYEVIMRILVIVNHGLSRDRNVIIAREPNWVANYPKG